MSALTVREDLAEEIRDLYTRLTGGACDEDLRRATELAQSELPQDHWLQTNHMDYESRLFLFTATALAMRSMKHSPHKCALFTRSAAEALATGQQSAA